MSGLKSIIGKDIVDAKTRSRMMAAIRGKDTKPELAVRRAAHAMGRRFRIHRADLPGRPDVVFPRDRVALFVHGCFWHRHSGCRYCTMPQARAEFWARKFEANVARDDRARRLLRERGWRAEVIWECETRDPALLARILQSLLAERAL
jgi:DNA mismatch endonuclease (patch repair protein)